MFPLTPTLSLRERGWPASVRPSSDARQANTALRITKRRGNILPLPEGEGGGEGEGAVIQHLLVECPQVLVFANNPAADVARSAAMPAKWFHGLTPSGASTASSRIGAPLHHAPPARHRASRLLSALRVFRAASHRVRCRETLQRKKSPGCMVRRCAGDGTYKLKNADLAARSTEASQPRCRAYVSCVRG